MLKNENKVPEQPQPKTDSSEKNEQININENFETMKIKEDEKVNINT